MLKNILSTIKSLVRFVGNFILGTCILLVVYLLFAFIFTLIPSNMFSKQPETGITIYIKSNGVHTDLVLPTENKFYNWSEHLPPEEFGLLSAENSWTAFGWGDKGFYLNTPEWADLKVSTALDAITPFVGGSAMHITHYEVAPKENKYTKKIMITDAQYLVLCDYIYKSFSRDEKENFILIPGHHYNGRNDNFYEAGGDYNLFQTCNNWTNSGLKTAGVKTALWAPFDKCILYHF